MIHLRITGGGWQRLNPRLPKKPFYTRGQFQLLKFPFKKERKKKKHRLLLHICLPSEAFHSSSSTMVFIMTSAVLTRAFVEISKRKPNVFWWPVKAERVNIASPAWSTQHRGSERSPMTDPRTARTHTHTRTRSHSPRSVTQRRGSHRTSWNLPRVEDKHRARFQLFNIPLRHRLKENPWHVPWNSPAPCFQWHSQQVCLFILFLF